MWRPVSSLTCSSSLSALYHSSVGLKGEDFANMRGAPTIKEASRSQAGTSPPSSSHLPCFPLQIRAQRMWLPEAGLRVGTAHWGPSLVVDHVNSPSLHQPLSPHHYPTRQHCISFLMLGPWYPNPPTKQEENLTRDNALIQGVINISLEMPWMVILIECKNDTIRLNAWLSKLHKWSWDQWKGLDPVDWRESWPPTMMFWSFGLQWLITTWPKFLWMRVAQSIFSLGGLGANGNECGRLVTHYYPFVQVCRARDAPISSYPSL